LLGRGGDLLAELRSRLFRGGELGGEPGDMSTAQFTAFVAAEVAAWAPVVRASGATVD